MGTHISSTKKKEKIELRHHASYNDLTNHQFIERLKSLIERTNSTEGLDPRSATEILLEDRK
jgi:hypothetical protein